MRPPPTVRTVVLGSARNGGIDGVGKLLEEVAEGSFGIEPDGLCVRSHERASKDPGRPARDVIALESPEERRIDFGRCGDGREIDPALLTFRAQPGTESFAHNRSWA